MDDIVRLIAVMSSVVGVPMLFIFGVPPLAKAFARRIEGKLPADEAMAAELDALRAEVEAMRELPGRLVELEERVDFAERLLAQQQGPGLIASGKDEVR